MSLMGLVQLASTCDALIMAWLEILMYRLKQSLDHLPKLMISHRGHPMAAAVVAAPILKECEVVFARPPVRSASKEFKSLLVKNLPFRYVKRGPWLVGCTARYSLKARIGHKGELLLARRMTVPSRNGSVLEALMLTLAMSLSMVRSWCSRVDCGSYFVLCVDVYSDTRRNPKKAVVRAAQSISLSSYALEELKRFCLMR